MSTQLSNGTTSQAGASIRENSRVARIKRVYASVPVGAKVTASNDSRYRAPAETAVDLDAWARRAAAANGFGTASTRDMPEERPDVDAVPASARQVAQAGLAEILATMADAFVSRLRAISASWRRAREVRETQRALENLDARTLHDIGFERSEVSSVAVEIAGGAPLTRIRALMTLRDLSY